METAQEYSLTMASRSDLFASLSATVKALHEYEVPEIIATALDAPPRSLSEDLDRL